ncbi:protein associated with UVRAG as autophagy enhancer isoform X2 [Siniperca chuatsi]|uniref:protein associated with UVRAG as autophagy enhancer isoform X2 n=1 Tax=Siniperca chuatsi TaxID=119488 RepID=UPI001CE02B39|nr:protein associated with UVRAG as autophagy enhancer isoform X2 [Siniperca chuatsi]
MMGSCRGMASSPQTTRYVDWCVSAESPTPVTPALTATATPEEVSHQNHRPAGSGSIPLLLLSPPEASEGETNTTFSHQHLQPTFTKWTHHEAFAPSPHSQLNPHSSSALHNSDKAPNSHADEGEDDDSEEGRKGNTVLHPEDESFLLPRSSPVISRHHRPVSWHGGGSDTSAPPSLESPSAASGLLSLDQCGSLTVTSLDDLGSKPSSCHRPSPLQEDKKPRCISVSSNLNRVLSAGLHLPFSEQQGLAEAHRGRGLTSCDAPHSSGLSTSPQHSKEKRRSGIPELSADIFKTSCELEKENAHFIVVDMVLEVLEGVKWTLSSNRWTSTTDTHQRTHCNMCTRRHTSSAEDSPPHEHNQRYKACRHTHCCSAGVNKHRRSDKDVKTSHRNTHSSYVHTHQHTQDEEEEEAGNDEAEHQPKTFSVLSTDSGFEDCGVDTKLTPRDSLRDAEWLAQQLVLEFRRSWLPSNGPRREQSLRSSLQELPGTGGVAVSSGSLAEEIRLRTRMRGSLSWAPPRFQIIFTVQPTHRRSEVVALQHFLCAGCGTEVEPKYIKKLRYCEYLGRYFCDCCHSGSEAVIPGRLLSCWDFGRYPVSDFSKRLLDSVCHQPLFDLTCVGKTLYSKVKELDKFRELQEQLLGIKKLLTACRLSGRVMTEFEQLPAHLTEQQHLFSMDDLLRVKKGQLVAQAKAVLHSAIDHVENCELCLARGFICEFCREKDIIFPFQSDVCRRCPVCRACFHKHCFVEKKCPKCARIQSRKKHPDRSMK